MPRVSVIIPNYNHAAFLRKRIDSVLEQSFENFEVILLDDCSTDNSRSIIEDYRHHAKVTQVGFNDVNSGSPFRQWEKGIQLAQGEFVWIAESDDYADKLFLETLIRSVDEHPCVGLIYCQSDIVNEQGEFVRNNKLWTDDVDVDKWDKSYINSGIEEIKTALSFKNTIPNASAVLIRKELFEADFVFPIEMKMLGDWMCWVQLLQNTDIAFIPQALNHFRVTSLSSRVHDNPKKRCHRLLEELMILNYLLDRNLLSLSQYKYRVQSTLANRMKTVRLRNVLSLCWYKIASNMKGAGRYYLIFKSIGKRILL